MAFQCRYNYIKGFKIIQAFKTEIIFHFLLKDRGAHTKEGKALRPSIIG
jgi:hypothetical protein